MAILNILLKILPVLGPIFEKILGGAKAQELAERKKMEEIQAFREGRISPRYFMLYCISGLFTLFCLLMLFSMFFPSYAPDLSFIRELLNLGRELGYD